MATGRRAFARASTPETLSAIIREEPQAIGSLAPLTPPPLRWIVERCLAKEPQDRYAATHDLARDLAGIRDHLSEVSLSAGQAAAALPGPLRWKRVVSISLAILAALAGALFLGKSLGRPPVPSFERLTFRRGEVMAARLAPDAQTVVYSFSAGGGPEDIYSLRTGSPEFRAHGLRGAQLLAVSSQGEMAVALGWEWGGPTIGYGTLARVLLAGGAPRQLLDDVMDADWAPDGKSLAVLRFVGGGTGRRIEFPIGKVLYETKGLPFLVEPRVSPRADAVAFVELDRPNGIYAVHLVDLAGRRRKLSDGWSETQGIAWSKDGKEIWFSAARRGEARALYAVTLSGRQRLVARVPGGLRLQDISSDGRVLLTQESTRREMAGRLSGDSADRDLSWLDYSAPADLSVDGKRLLFVEAGEGSGESHSLWLKEVGGSAPVRLGEGSVGSSLSPDGKWVAALRVVSNGPNELHLVATGAGDARSIPLQGVSPLHTIWFPDGERLLIWGRAKDGKLRSYVVGLSGGAPRPVTPEGEEGADITPDGKWILCEREGRLTLYPVEGGEHRSLSAKLGDAWPLRFAAEGRSIFLAAAGVPARILRVDVQTGQTTNVSKELAPADPAGVRTVVPALVTPDGRHYVYTYRRVLSDLYLAEGLK